MTNWWCSCCLPRLYCCRLGYCWSLAAECRVQTVHSTRHAIWWIIMTDLQESLTPAVLCSSDVVCTPCTECVTKGRCPCNDTEHSRGPHLKCTEPSLKQEQERVWQSVRYLPGVRLRPTPAATCHLVHRWHRYTDIVYTLVFIIIIIIIRPGPH